MKRLLSVLVLLVALVAGFTAIPTFANGVATVHNFNPAEGEFPEALVIDKRGNIYVSTSTNPNGRIYKFTPEGNGSIYANLPSPGAGFVLGMAFDRRENLYVAMASFDPATHGIWKVSRRDHSVSKFAALPES